MVHSMLILSVGNLEADWGRHTFVRNHSQLFQPCDLAQVPYYYMDENDILNRETGGYNLVRETKDGLSKPLDQVIERLDLLGYTETFARKEFEFFAHCYELDQDELSFEQLARTLALIDITAISADYGEHESFGKFFRRCLFDKIGLQQVVRDPEYVRACAGQSLEHLSANTILRLIAQNPLTKDLNVNWQFADLEDEGLARHHCIESINPKNRFLIVTEGSSDATIIKHALTLLKPHVVDFFDFVDMNEGYPFTGTGNLYNFTKGLISISVQNNLIILYDNDAEGVWNYKRTADLNLPENMRVLRLPDLPEFTNVKAIGPAGEQRMDINGKAAAIECYLDARPEITIRWKNLHEKLNIYHGVPDGKREITKSFLTQSKINDEYDFSRISAVLDKIISECAVMMEIRRIAELEAW